MMFEICSILARGQATAETFEISRPWSAEHPGEVLELTLIDAVIAACELSEDETEVGDLVDAIVRRPDVRVVEEPRPAPWAQSSDSIPRAAA